MKMLKIALVLAASLGWMAPFAWSMHITILFIQKILWPQARWGLAHIDSDHLFFYVQWILYPSLLWAFAAACFWICRTMRRS